MKKRINFSNWGRGCGRPLPAWAMCEEYEEPIEAVIRAIERRTGLTVCTSRDDGISIMHGRPESRHYQLTLGKALPRRLGGGYSVYGEVWIAIPCAREKEVGNA